MKYFLLFLLLTGFQSNAQPVKSGTYLFKYCDIEYNKCISNCKVVIKGYHITIYATKELSASVTGFKSADIIEKGILIRNKKGKWTIKSSLNNEANDTENFLFLDFKTREFWCF